MKPFWMFAGALAVSAASAQDPSVALDLSAHSRANSIFRRAESRAGRLGMAPAFPQNLDSAADFFGTSRLSDYDRHWLENWEPGLRPERIRWNDSARGNSFYLAPEIQAGGVWSDDSSGKRALGGLGLTAYGRVLRDLIFYSHGAIYTERTGKAQFTHQYDPNFGETYSAEVTAKDTLAKSRTFNRHEYYLKYQGRVLTVKAGRDWIHLGPGYFSSLTATRDTPPYYLLEVRLDFAPWLYLDDYLIRMTDTRHDILKYAHIHRFDFKPLGNLDLGFEDMVIYQDRDPDPRYLLPLAPLAFAEENNGGGDNASMMFDFLYAPIRNVSFWGELFLDDLLGPTSFFDDWWENRWAALWGFQILSPWKSVDADLVVEESHVEPWTYIGREFQTSFKHFNVPSASKLGPDSKSWDVQLGYRLWKWAEWKGRWEWNEKGMGRQATLGVVHNDSDGTSKKFLDGPVNREADFTQTVSVQWGRYARVEGWWRRVLTKAGEDGFGATAVLGW